MSRRFLFAMFDGGGTVPPQLGLARRLVARGHQVRVLGDLSMKDDAVAAGCTFVPYSRAPSRPDRDPASDPIRDWEVKNPFELFRRAGERIFFTPALAFAQDVLHELSRLPADVIATDCLLFGPMLAGEKAGLPVVLMMPNCYMFPAPGLPAFGAGFFPARTFLGRARDRIIGRLLPYLLGKGRQRINLARKQLGLPSVRHPLDLVQRAERVLVMTSRAFDFEATSLPANVRYVGAQLEDPPWAASWASPWPAAHPDPLVLVGMSSTFQDQGKTLARVVEAFRELPARALVTLGPSLPREAVTSAGLPDNVVVRQSAPHSRVLPQAAAVVTHAGHGTVIRALAHGVPLVCMPMGRDQHDNAARVRWRGVGVAVSRHAKVPLIRAAVRQVLSEPRFRENAQRLASAIATETRRDLAVEEMEGLAAARGIAIPGVLALPKSRS